MRTLHDTRRNRPVALIAAALVTSLVGCSGGSRSDGAANKKTSEEHITYTCVDTGTYSNQFGNIGYCYRGVTDGLQYWELYFESEAGMNGQADYFRTNDPTITILYLGNAGGYWQMNYTTPG